MSRGQFSHGIRLRRGCLLSLLAIVDKVCEGRVEQSDSYEDKLRIGLGQLARSTCPAIGMIPKTAARPKQLI